MTVIQLCITSLNITNAFILRYTLSIATNSRVVTATTK